MKDMPILFNGAMVRAILEGRKTQTRRVIKPQPPRRWLDYFAKRARGYTSLSLPEVKYFRTDDTEVKCPYGLPGDQQGTKFRDSSPPSDGWYWARWTPHDNEKLVWLRRFHSPEDEIRDGVPDNDVERWLWGVSPQDDPESICLDVAEPLDIKWRRPGDRLWVRETWLQINEPPPDNQVYYRADGEDIPGPWRPSIHMPRWASRLTLEVTRVWVEQVQDISEEDAIAEGSQIPCAELPKSCQQATMTERTQFSRIWDSINAKRGYSWERNPWVWVVEFKLEQAC